MFPSWVLRFHFFLLRALTLAQQTGEFKFLWVSTTLIIKSRVWVHLQFFFDFWLQEMRIFVYASNEALWFSHLAFSWWLITLSLLMSFFQCIGDTQKNPSDFTLVNTTVSTFPNLLKAAVSPSISIPPLVKVLIVVLHSKSLSCSSGHQWWDTHCHVEDGWSSSNISFYSRLPWITPGTSCLNLGSSRNRHWHEYFCVGGLLRSALRINTCWTELSCNTVTTETRRILEQYGWLFKVIPSWSKGIGSSPILNKHWMWLSSGRGCDLG